MHRTSVLLFHCSLNLMNDSTIEVKTASVEMSQGNKAILEDF